MVLGHQENDDELALSMVTVHQEKVGDLDSAQILVSVLQNACSYLVLCVILN
jgi:hypothetical protein